MRWIVAVMTALVFAGAAPRPVVAAPPVGDDYQVSEEGHPFRVRFDPASRIWAGVAGAVGFDEDGLPEPIPEVNFGVSYRAMFISGEGSGRVSWQVDHRVLAGWIWPLHRRVENIPALDITLYSASLLRHDEVPRIVLPSSPPVSVPFPFDVGFETEMGRVFVPGFLPTGLAGAAVPMLRVGVLRATAFVDPWRSGTPGRSLEIGIGARYDIEPLGIPTLDQAFVVHRIAPGTAASLRFRWKADDGIVTVEGRGDVIPHWTSDASWKLMALASARVERTLLAINDQPIVAVLDGGYRRTPETSLTAATNDIRVSLGLTFNVQLK